MSLFYKSAILFTAFTLVFTATAAASASPMYNSQGALMVSIERIAGNHLYGEEDSRALSGSLRAPAGLVVGPKNTLYIADTDNHKIRELTSDQFGTFAGPKATTLRSANGLPLGTLRDGDMKSAFFNSPSAMAVGADGSLYVADSGNHSIRKITASGNVVTLAGNGQIGSTDGSGKAASFYHPEGVAVSKTGVVYVSDTLNHTIREIQPDGTTRTLTSASKRIVERYPGYAMTAGDYRDGAIKDSLFNEPVGLAIDSMGNLYVSDSGNQRIRYIDFGNNRVTTVAGGATTKASSVYEKNALYANGGYADGPSGSASFNFPKGIALDSSGGLLIADSANNVIRYFNKSKVSTLAGSASGTAGSQDGIESTALFDNPQGIAIASDGTLYVADTGNNIIRTISPYQLPAGISGKHNINVVIEDRLLVLDTYPENKSGNVMVPIRKITESLGYTVTSANKGQKIILQKNNKTIELVLGSNKVKFVDKEKETSTSTIGATPYTLKNRTYVPLRFIAEVAGMDVQWDRNSQTVILRYKEQEVD